MLDETSVDGATSAVDDTETSSVDGGGDVRGADADDLEPPMTSSLPMPSESAAGCGLHKANEAAVSPRSPTLSPRAMSPPRAPTGALPTEGAAEGAAAEGAAAEGAAAEGAAAEVLMASLSLKEGVKEEVKEEDDDNDDGDGESDDAPPSPTDREVLANRRRAKGQDVFDPPSGGVETAES